MDSRRQTPAEPEKDRYTYDEIMARLRRQRSGNEQRVVVDSPDGPVEVRKKRRRRSHQPKKALEERATQLKKLALLVGIPAVLLVIGAHLLLQARYQSDSFRSGVSERITEILGAESEIAQLKVSGLSISSRNLAVVPEGNSLLREAEFTSLTGSITPGSLFSSDWHLKSLTAVHSTVRLHSPSTRSRLSQSSSTGHELLAAGIGLAKRPGAFDIDKFQIADADFTWIPLRGKEFTFIEGGSTVSRKIGSTSDLHITSGKFQLPGWPIFDIESAKLRLSSGAIELTEGDLSHKFIGNLGGDASLTGKVDLSRPSPIADFDCEFDAMPLESLVRPALKKKVEGDIDANLNFKAVLAVPDSPKITGSFLLRQGSLGDITPLKSLAALVSEPRLARIEFHSVKGNYTLSGGASVVENLEAIAPGLIHITGSYAIQEDGILNGTLEVGIADSILAHLPGEKPDCFGETDAPSGMSFATVKLSGTCNDPLEDLTPRLDAALEKFERESAAPPASSYPTIPLAPGAKKNTRPPTTDPAKKQAEDAFNQIIKP